MSVGEANATDNAGDHLVESLGKPDGRLPSVGVLFVHGIGQQPYGATLASGLDVLSGWLRDRIGDGNSQYRISVEDARLRQSELSPGVPAHAVMHLVRSPHPHSSGKTLHEKWLFVESWWAESFPRPSYPSVVRWTVASTIATVSSEIAEFYERLTISVRRRRIAQSIQTLFGLYIYVLILAPVLLLVLLLSISAFIPWLRRAALTAQNALTGSVGDSYALTEGSTRRSAIVGKTRRDLEWLLAHGPERLLVIAHSQGAEVARQALETTPSLDKKQVRLITYGSGIRKLLLLERLRTGGRAIPRVRIVVGSSLLVVASTLALVYGLVFLGHVQDAMAGQPNLHSTWFVPSEFLLVAVYLLTPVVIPRIFRSEYPPTVNARHRAGDADYAASRGEALRFLLTAAVAGIFLASLSGYDLLKAGAPELPYSGATPWVVSGLALALYVGSRVACAVDQINTYFVEAPHSSGVKDFMWIDIIASSDPVAAPGLTSRTRGQPRTFVVHNFRSILFDHTRYWQNWSEFMPRIMAQMHGVSQWDGRDLFRVPRSWVNHEAEVRSRLTLTLVALRFEALFLVSFFLFRLTTGQGIGDRPEARGVLAAVNAALRISRVSGGLQIDVRNTTAQVVVVATMVLLAGVLLYRGAVSAWRADQRRRRRRSIAILHLLDEAALREPGLVRKARLVTRVTMDSHEALLVLTNKQLSLFRIGPGGRIMDPISVSRDDLEVKVGLGAVRLLLPDRHIHVRPTDFLTKRRLADEIKSL